jgi:hypothetical protein
MSKEENNIKILTDLIEYLKEKHSNLPSHVFEIIGEVIDDLQTKDEVKRKREEGYYWTYGNKCFDVKSWSIYYWDGNYFWNGNEDFSEDSFEMIDEKEIKRDE